MAINRTLRWHPHDGAGLEHCEITGTAEAITARSVLIGSREGRDFGLTYELRLDPDWTFRSLSLERVDGARLALHADGSGRWIDTNNRHLAALDGCIHRPVRNAAHQHAADPARPARARAAGRVPHGLGSAR